MADFKQKIILDVVPDSEGDIKKFRSNVGNEFKKVRTESKKTEKAFQSVGSSIKKLVVAGAGLIAFRKFNAVISESITLFGIQAEAEAKVAQTIKATGSAAGVTTDELKTMAAELQKVTKFGDEMTLRGQSMLLTFKNIGKDVFPQATEAMLNLAEAMGTDVKDSAIQLGKALNDPAVGITALSRVGITFSENQKGVIKSLQKTGDIAGAQKIILAELESQFGGLARAAALAGTGPLVQFQNRIGDIKEDIGKAFLPVIMQVSEQLSSIFTPPSGDLEDMVQGIAENFVVINTILVNATNTVKIFFDGILSGVFTVAEHIQTLKIGFHELTLASAELNPFASEKTLAPLRENVRFAEALREEYKATAIEFANSVNKSVQGYQSIGEALSGYREKLKALDENKTVGVGGSGGGSGDTVDTGGAVDAEKLKQAGLEKLQIKFEIAEMVLMAQEESQQRELELAKLHFDHMAEMETRELAKKDSFIEAQTNLHESKLSEIKKKWKDKTTKDADNNQKKEFSMLRQTVSIRTEIASNLIGAASNFAEALGAEGKTLKKFALAESIVQGVRATMFALNSAPFPPASIPQAVATGLFAASKTAVIASQAFAKGGLPVGKNALVTMNEKGQEGVLNAPALNSMGVGELNARNQGSSPNTSVTNDIHYAPTINISGGGNSALIEALENDLPALALLIEDTVKKGYLNASEAFA